MNSTLLRAKLYSPHPPVGLVSRPRLFERLDQGVNCQLTFICAPAGYGKSTLAHSWLKTCPRPAAWLSLDEQDNDLSLFLAYFGAAIQTLFPNGCSQTLNLLQSPQEPPAEHLTTTLINEIAALPETFILVLDDYHFINRESIHQFINRLVNHMPVSMQLVLISRETPPLQISRLRANQAILEIRPHDLRFSPDETGAFLEQFLGAPLPGEIVELLTERTEGWIACLQLAAFSLRSQPDPKRFVETFQGTNRYIMEYLVDEIISQLPQAIRDFLLQISILNRFCGPLCDAVTGNSDAICNGQAYLEWLQSARFLLVSLDDDNLWYRHHHLFQDLLRHKLQTEMAPQEIAALHVRAAGWLAGQGLVEEALLHLLAAGDTLGAAQLVENNRHRLLNQVEWRKLQHWLALLPADLLQKRPGLLMARILVLLFTLNVRVIPALIQTAEALLPEPSLLLTPAEAALIGAEIDVFRGVLAYWQGQGQRSFDHFQRALPQLSSEHTYLQGITLVYSCMALQMMGQPELALTTAANAYQDEAAPEAMFFNIYVAAAQVFVHLMAGEVSKCIQPAEYILRQSDQHHYANQLAWGHYFLGYAHYIWNNLETAESHLKQATEWRYNLNTRAAMDSLALLTLTYQARQQPAKATQTIKLLLDFARQSQNPAYLALADSCQARLALQQGDPEAATRWLQTADISADVGAFSVWQELPRLTYCRVLIAQGTARALSEAVENLQAHLKMAEDTHNTRQRLEILILQSLAYHAQGQVEAALTALKRAVRLAQPGGFIRCFVEGGLPLAGLLRQLAGQGVAPDYVRQILAAFPDLPFAIDDWRLEDKGIENIQRALRLESEIENPLIEPLTNRELDVLELLAQRLSNQEIAQKLYISVLTVKSHTVHIYRKLEAKNRYQAVTKAKALGLLPVNIDGKNWVTPE